MKLKLTTITFLCLSLFIYQACKEKEKETPTTTNNTPVDSCKIKNYTYNNTISSIISNNCTNSCHKPGQNASNFDMTNYNNLKTQAEKDAFLNRLKSTSSPMPPTGKLNDSIIKKIECWKSSGYVN